MLNNYDEDETMNFAFDLSSHLASSVLAISPDVGEIPPQSHAVRTPKTFKKTPPSPPSTSILKP